MCEVIEGELEVTIDGVAQIARAGLVAIVPGSIRHSVKALTDGRAIIVDYPARHEFGLDGLDGAAGWSVSPGGQPLPALESHGDSSGRHGNSNRRDR